jgi:hypothetical protein
MVQPLPSTAAFGVTYNTVAAVDSRLHELAELSAQYGDSDDRVTETNALAAARADLVAQHEAAARPYVVLTRKYLPNGDCRKGRRTFRTAAEQSRFIGTTDTVVTFYTV